MILAEILWEGWCCALPFPLMIAQFVNILYSIIDRMYIGNIPEIGDLAFRDLRGP